MDPAEQRANAVAKLRRAASLPRMKDGRRPPMHGEGGFSEGERSRSVEKRREEGGVGGEAEAVAGMGTGTETALAVGPATETKIHPETTHEPTLTPTPEKVDARKEAAQETQEERQDVQETSELERPTTPAQHNKRRSRSRSRSRGSKDLRAKIRQLDLATASTSTSPAPITVQNDVLDDAFSPDSPQLTSPQAYLMQLQLAPALSAVSPLSPFGVGPFIAAPSAPLMPSLQTLQSRHLQGLFRSNSAAARMMAMHKLTGEPLNFGPTPNTTAAQGTSTPRHAGLSRSNTVAGEERVAARQQLLRRLNERIQDKSDIETTSGPEDALSTTSTSKSRRRRSRRKSGSSAVVDDREFLGATAAAFTSPTPSATPAPTFHELYPPLIALPLSRSPTAASPAPNHYQYDSPIAHRGLVVEEEDDDDPVPTPPRAAPRLPLPFPLSSLAQGQASTSTSTSPAGGRSTPSLLGDLTQRNGFPRSPFGTPLRERARDGDEELEEERVLYGADAARMGGATGASGAASASDREISWVAEPVPVLTARRLLEESDRENSWTGEAESRLASIAERDVSWVEPSTLGDRMPVYDEDEDEENDEESKEAPADEMRSMLRPQSRKASPRDSTESQELLIDLEATPDHTPDHTPLDYSVPSQHSATSTATANINARESAISSLSGTSAPQGDSSPRLLARTHSQADSLQGWPELGGGSSDAPALASKRSADSSITSAWGRVKSTFARSGSSLGRRSRTNSIARERDREKRGDTESSRESAASLASGRRESRGDAPAPTWQPGQGTNQPQNPPAPSPATSTPVLLVPPPRTGVSPIPPPSDTDAAKYANPKLFPFPGMVRLQEETQRNRVMSGSVSSPDIVLQQSASSSTSADGAMRSANSSMSSQHQQHHDSLRERKLSHQASDSRLLPKYQLSPGPAISGAPSSGGAQIDYFNIPQPPVSSNTLPFTREGVKKWLSARLFPSASQQGGPAISPSPGHKSRIETTKKSSLSELLGGKDIENISDWDDIDKPRAPTSTSMSTVVAKSLSKDNSREGEIQESSPDDPVLAYQYANSFPHEPQGNATTDTDGYDTHDLRHLSAPLSSSQDPSSATPDPGSSEESPSQSSRRSRSSMDSLYSPEESAVVSAQAVEILQRLDHVLRSDNHNRLWGPALTTPPRRLMLSSPMLQVVNCNTVKDRFLFLFSDIIVIAKPMLPERDSLHDTQKIYPPDRKFFVKNVVHLKDVRLNVDRDEDTNQPTSAVVAQRPEFLRNFVHEFAESPDTAIARIVDIHDPKGCVTLGRLIVQLPEIDRARLGEYLSRRTSKTILKAYIDAFGFVGISIDMSLRIFLLSIHIPTGPGNSNTLETLLDTFAARWYEANAGIVAFDRDLAVRLVRAIVRLNEALYAAISHDMNGASYSRSFVTTRDFTEAFRRHDPRNLIPDSTLDGIYASVRQEKLCQARNPTNGRAPNPISLKRPIPSRITYRRQSEPIVVRIPQADPQLTIQLFGQDLTFDPPMLTFAKAAEASFRVTGTAFGPKTMIMACAGPAAPNYSGLPLSTTVAVERAFMRNTFQLAFTDATCRKRKYMFSVDDPVIRHEWTGSLKRQIEAARVAQGAAPELPQSVQVQVYRAADAIAFNVLQDTLLMPETSARGTSSMNGTLRSVAQHDRGLSGVSSHSGSAQNSTDPAPARESYTRSQSRSQVYRLGAGRHEYEPSGSPSPSPRPGAGTLTPVLPAFETRLWTGGDLALLCQQNSAIALVLSFLQAALPYDADWDEASAGFLGVSAGTNPNHVFQFPAPPVQRNQSQSSAYQI